MIFRDAVLITLISHNETLIDLLSFLLIYLAFSKAHKEFFMHKEMPQRDLIDQQSYE